MSDAGENGGGKLEIQYPCRWQYRLIGEAPESIRAAIREVLGVPCTGGTRRHSVAEGNVSSGGRYRTLVLELDVTDEEERLRLQRLFSEHPAIRVV
jgi:putative lipoic acid-binding regulatory protein